MTIILFAKIDVEEGLISQQQMDDITNQLETARAALNSRNFTAKVLVQNSAHAIKSGMFARVEIKLDGSTS